MNFTLFYSVHSIEINWFADIMNHTLWNLLINDDEFDQQ